MIFIVCFIGALAFAIGNIFQKMGLHKVRVETSNLKDLVLGTVKNLPWLAGIGLSVIGTLAFYYALSMWPLSTVQALMALNPSMTAIFGIIFLKEYYDKQTVSGVVLVIVGVLLVSMASMIQGDSTVSNPEIGVLFWPTLGILVAGILILILWAWFPKFLAEESNFTKTQEYRRGEYFYSIIGGLGFGASAVFYKAFTLQFTAASMQLSQLDFSAMLMVLFYVLTYIIGFFSSQAALSYGRALFVIPFSAAIGSIIPIFCGIITLGEESGPFQWAGVLIVSIALFLFIPRGDFSNIHSK